MGENLLLGPEDQPLSHPFGQQLRSYLAAIFFDQSDLARGWSHFQGYLANTASPWHVIGKTPNRGPSTGPCDPRMRDDFTRATRSQICQHSGESLRADTCGSIGPAPSHTQPQCRDHPMAHSTMWLHARLRLHGAGPSIVSCPLTCAPARTSHQGSMIQICGLAHVHARASNRGRPSITVASDLQSERRSRLDPLSLRYEGRACNRH